MIAYLDTSSLVKLYVTEAGSDKVQRLVADADLVATSVVAYPETRAALARLRREGSLSAPAFATAKRTFERQWPSYLSLEATNELCRLAGALAEAHRLRSFDSIHLASFVEIARLKKGSETTFSSFDDRLNQAAQKVQSRARP